MNWHPGGHWILVEWFGGPHDGLRQGVEVDLSEWRTCQCHGVRYRASRESWGWALTIHEGGLEATASARLSVARPEGGT